LILIPSFTKISDKLFSGILTRVQEELSKNDLYLGTGFSKHLSQFSETTPFVYFSLKKLGCAFWYYLSECIQQADQFECTEEVLLIFRAQAEK